LHVPQGACNATLPAFAPKLYAAVPPAACLLVVAEDFFETWPLTEDAKDRLLLLRGLYVAVSRRERPEDASSTLLLHWQGGLGLVGVVLQGAKHTADGYTFSRAMHVKPGARVYVQGACQHAWQGSVPMRWTQA
jgi:hypothetical protein